MWLSPQSYWIGKDVNILKYESEEDWNLVCDMMDIDKDKINIKKDYEISNDLEKRIKNIYYPQDKEIFKIYNE